MRMKTTAVEGKVLDAAIALFSSQHFHEVRMEDVATEAAVGKGTIYRYFSDKEELYQALVERASQQYLDRLRESVAGNFPTRTRLTSLIQTILTFFDDQPHLCDLIQRAEVMHRALPWQQVRTEVLALVRGLFEEGNARQEFVVGDPELVALLLLGGLRTVFRTGHKPRAADLAEQILGVFLKAR